MAELAQTPLHAAHVEAGAKMVDFTGWHMPVQYAGILAEHKAVREDVGIFDVSHMGEIDFHGPEALAAVQRLITNDATKLVDGQALYTAVCLQSGGIVDDCIVYRRGAEDFRIVVNASNIGKDEAHFREHVGHMCEIVNRSDETALIAVQGPRARWTTAQVARDSSVLDIAPFHFASTSIVGQPVVAARTGYTGEDGFELFVAASGARQVWDALMAGGATPCGLGARDTLRLEAKLCLYGNDIDETTTPYEAGLGWVVKPKAGPFVGSEALAAQLDAGLEQTLVGFVIKGKGTARHDWELVASPESGAEVIGRVTSGGPAPTVGGSVGIGYVRPEFAKPGTLIAARSQHKILPAEIVKGPFYRRPA
jgi:aminomethyltransferase